MVIATLHNRFVILIVAKRSNLSFIFLDISDTINNK